MSGLGKIENSAAEGLPAASTPAPQARAGASSQQGSGGGAALTGLANIKKALGMGRQPTLIVGCGRDGTQWNSPAMNKKHQHERNGDCTVDIAPENNPHLVCDFTEKGVANDARHAAVLNKFGKFSKVSFESFPGHLFADEAKREAMADNVNELTTRKAKVVVRVGANSPELQNFAATLKARGFEPKSLGIKNGQYVLKAKRSG